MKLGVALPQFGPRARDPEVGERIREVAIAADELGYDVVWTAEHLIFPYEIRTPYPYGGKFPFPVTDPILDVATTLSYAAAATSRVRLGSAVVVLPLHHPVALAKALATVDVLSRGRLVAGFGGGWLEEEFELVGVPFRERGARMDETLALVKALWTQDRVSFHGRFFTVEDAAFFPKPAQKPHPPIWIGGDGARALRRVGELADGWLASPRDLDRLTDSIAAIRRHAEAAGRNPAAIGVASSGGARSIDELLDSLPRLEKIGVTIVNVPALFWTKTVGEAVEMMAKFARLAGTT